MWGCQCPSFRPGRHGATPTPDPHTRTARLVQPDRIWPLFSEQAHYMRACHTINRNPHLPSHASGPRLATSE